MSVIGEVRVIPEDVSNGTGRAQALFHEISAGGLWMKVIYTIILAIFVSVHHHFFTWKIHFLSSSAILV